MLKVKTPSFILDLPLRTTPSQEKTLLVRLEAARQLYNACLGETLRRLALLRESKGCKKAKKLPKGAAKKAAFKDLNAKYNLKESDIHRYAVKIKNSCFIKDHLDVHTTQKVATRVFKAVNEYAFGKRGKPRFKGRGQLDSVESKSNVSGIRFRDDTVFWNGLILPCIFDQKDKHGIEVHGLSCKTKYVRIVRRKIKGKNLFYAQLIQEGLPKQKTKNLIGEGVVALDVGPSTVAVYTEDHAELLQFCEELKPVHQQIKSLQRKMDRQRRANNPGNYNGDGTIKEGKLHWVCSGHYIETRAKLSELFRKQVGYRKSLHGRMVNKILAYGKNIKTEKLSFIAFQKIYGKSVGFRAPGLFMSKLTRKAESAGGRVDDLNTKKLKLSQTCHCGIIKKKALSQRWHNCGCGAVAQRDLYSAFLAYYVIDGSLDTSMAAASWRGADLLLQQAVSRLTESASGRVFPASFGIRRQSGSSAKADGVVVKERDAVPGHYCESPIETITDVRTPWLSAMGRISLTYQQFKL